MVFPFSHGSLSSSVTPFLPFPNTKHTQLHRWAGCAAATVPSHQPDPRVCCNLPASPSARHSPGTGSLQREQCWGSSLLSHQLCPIWKGTQENDSLSQRGLWFRGLQLTEVLHQGLLLAEVTHLLCSAQHPALGACLAPTPHVNS